MPCPAFEEILQGYEELTAFERRRADSHLAVCADCREYVETLTELDRELTGLYAGLQPHPEFAAEAVSRARASKPPLREPRRLSAWPEVLDFCGWVAIAAIVSLLTVMVAAQSGVTPVFLRYAAWYAVAALAAAGLVALRLRALPRD
jgi:anti-sigma factor RsiW